MCTSQRELDRCRGYRSGAAGTSRAHQLRAAIGELKFVDETVATSVAEDLGSVERQLKREDPPRGVARELLTSARHTLEGAAGGGVAEHADKLADVYELFDRAISALS